MLRFYGIGPREWDALPVQSQFQLYIDMPRICAAERIELAQALAVAFGNKDAVRETLELADVSELQKARAMMSLESDRGC